MTSRTQPHVRTRPTRLTPRRSNLGLFPGTPPERRATGAIQHKAPWRPNASRARPTTARSGTRNLAVKSPVTSTKGTSAARHPFLRAECSLREQPSRRRTSASTASREMAVRPEHPKSWFHRVPNTQSTRRGWVKTRPKPGTKGGDVSAIMSTSRVSDGGGWEKSADRGRPHRAEPSHNLLPGNDLRRVLSVLVWSH